MSIEPPKKLLIVDDSAFMRKVIADFFADHPRIQVVGTARNGKDALQKIESLQPDVLTLDEEMPEMNGLDVLRAVMATHRLPVVMLASASQAGMALKAIEYGAVDFVAKPSGSISLDLHKIKSEIVAKTVAAASISRDKLRPRAALPPVKKQPAAEQPVPAHRSASKSDGRRLVAIGTSTGGPRALQEVLTKLPASFAAPILIVQHMPAGFTKSLAARLDQLSAIAVKEAERGDLLRAGTAYIAPGGYHMRLQKIGTGYAIELDADTEPVSGHRPAVDVLFDEVSRCADFAPIAVVMTGMGADGTEGLRALKARRRTLAIAESERTCIVYGMPKAAVETGLVDYIEDVDDIAQRIIQLMP